MAFLNTFFSFFLFLLFVKKKKLFILIPILLLVLSSIILSSEKLKKRFIYNTGAHLIGIDNADEIGVFKNIFANLNNGIHAKIFLTSINLTKDNPIFGNGIKSYRHRCFEMKVYNCSSHPHNTYLELSHDGGILLMLSYYYFFILMLFNNFKFKIKNYYNLAIVTMIITFLNPLQITGSIFSTWSAGIMFFIFGLTLFPKKKNEFK